MPTITASIAICCALCRKTGCVRRFTNTILPRPPLRVRACRVVTRIVVGSLQSLPLASRPRMAVTASVTDFIVDPLVDFCVDVIGEIGYVGIFLLMLVESANIPMPSEATMLFAGFKVDEGDLTLFGITAAGVLGNIVGSWAGYAIGYYGREELLERHHIFHVSPKQMARVEGWFERYGGITVFFTRMLPIVRTFISTPAGAAHMNFA